MRPKRSGGSHIDAVRTTWALAGIAAVLCVVGCGLPVDSEPRALAGTKTSVSEATTTTSAATDAGSGTAYAWLWDGDSERLFPRQRSVDVNRASAVVSMALAAPSAVERANELTSRIPGNTELVSPPVTSGQSLTINLSSEMNVLKGAAQRQAFAQITLAATQIPGIDRVHFEIDGKAIDVTGAEGQTDTVTVCDFRDLLADPAVVRPAALTSGERKALVEQVNLASSSC